MGNICLLNASMRLVTAEVFDSLNRNTTKNRKQFKHAKGEANVTVPRMIRDVHRKL